MIYFAQPVNGGPVKIGTTKDLDTRRAGLESSLGTRLAILHTMAGGRQEEKEIHERFAHLRLGRTEQFRPAADLMAFIGRPLLVDPNPDAVEAIKPRSRGRFNTLVRMDDEVCAKARKLAALRGTTMAELFASILRPAIDREWSRTIRKLKDAEDKPPT